MAERDLQWMKDSIKSGLKFQERVAHSQMWATYKAYYRHEFPAGIIPVNLVFSILRSTVPQIYFRNPAVSLTPTKPGIEFELHARLMEDVDNWLLRELSTKYQIKKMINDAFLCGIANGFIGFDSEFGYDPSKTVAGTPASLTLFDKKGDRIEYNSNIYPGMPWFLRARPEDVVYPWGCEDKSTAEWVALRVFRPLDDIKKDKKYTGTADLNGSFVQRRTTGEGTTYPNFMEEKDLKDHEWVELWQVHDAKTREILALTMDHDKFLRKEEDLMQIDGLPVETITFNPDPDYIYGIPDTRIIEPQLLELNEIRTQAMKHRRIDIVKMLFKKGVLARSEIEKLLNENVQAAVEVDTDAPDLRQAIMPMTPGATTILADMERAGEVVRGDIRESVGFSRSSTGEFQGKTHITAKETEIVNWANQIRIDERRDMVADLLTNVVRKFNQLVFTYWNTDIVRSIIGPDGAKYWIRFNPSEIKGEYGIKVDPTNAVPVDQRTKRQEAIEMSQAWASMNPGQAKMGIPAPAELQRYFFSQYDGIDIDKLLAQQGQPQPGAGMNPQQAVPPGAAADIMRGRMQQGGGV
jgi:hypothetical protein